MAFRSDFGHSGILTFFTVIFVLVISLYPLLFYFYSQQILPNRLYQIRGQRQRVVCPVNLLWYYRIMKKNIKPSTRLSSLTVEFDREDDGRWIAEIPKLPGVMAYGATKREAQQRVYAIALRTLADDVERGSFFTPVSRMFGYGVARG